MGQSSLAARLINAEEIFQVLDQLLNCSTRVYDRDKDVADIIGVFGVDVYKDDEEAATWYITVIRLQVTFHFFSAYCPNIFGWICVSFSPHLVI